MRIELKAIHSEHPGYETIVITKDDVIHVDEMLELFNTFMKAIGFGLKGPIEVVYSEQKEAGENMRGTHNSEELVAEGYSQFEHKLFKMRTRKTS